MKTIYFLVFLSLIFSGCDRENDFETPNVSDGRYILEIYDQDGKLALTREGDARHHASGEHLRIDDPLFIDQSNEKPHETFASLMINSSHPLSSKKFWTIDSAVNTAYILQRWYRLYDDWGYQSVSGNVRIHESTNAVLKGEFKIHLELIPNDERNFYAPYFANPLWGKQITVKGYFASIEW